MVVIKLKFFCGEGDLAIHYCRVCGIPHLCIDEAKECELRHVNNVRDGEEAPNIMNLAKH